MATGPRLRTARAPEEWPPTSAHMRETLLDIFGQHLLGQRDYVVQRAFDTIVKGQPYAKGTVHQRPFAALGELNLDEQTRDRIVDVVAVFVDESMEQFLRLLGSITNTVGEHHTITYEMTAHIDEHEEPAATRYDLSALYAAWSRDLGGVLGEEVVSSDGSLPEDGDETAEQEMIPITRGKPVWFEYRKWLRHYSSFRPSARPTREE